MIQLEKKRKGVLDEWVAVVWVCASVTVFWGGQRQSLPGMIRFMNSSNMGTVKAVSP